jgi:hypothetical protein
MFARVCPPTDTMPVTIPWASNELLALVDVVVVVTVVVEIEVEVT